jgi:hypothetical protein
MKHIKTYNKLFEGLSDAEKYKKDLKIKDIDWYILKRLDPSPTFKYIAMICKYALEGVNIDDIKNYIKAFDMLISKDKIKDKDIFSYKTFYDLKHAIDSIEDKKTKKEILDQIKKEREIIIDNEDYLVFIPLSYEASIKYGMGAKWCISMKTDPFMWYALTKANILFYFVIVKNKEISAKLFDKYKKNLEDSGLGSQGDKRDPENFAKFAVMTFGGNDEGGKRHKQIYTKSNHLLLTKYNKDFFKDLGLSAEIIFKNDLPFKEIEFDDLDENVKYKIMEDVSFYNHYDNDSNLPKKNDYVLIKHKEDTRAKKMTQINAGGGAVTTPLEEYVNNNVGQIIYIGTQRSFNKNDKGITVKYTNIPKNVITYFHTLSDGTKYIDSQFREIVAFSEDTEDLEKLVMADKYNL